MRSEHYNDILRAFQKGICSDIREVALRILSHGPATGDGFAFKADDEWMWNMQESSYADIEICDSGENTVLAREKVVGMQVNPTAFRVVTETGAKENIEYLFSDDAVCLLAWLEEVLAALEDGDIVLCSDSILRDREDAHEWQSENDIPDGFVDLGLRRDGKRILFAKANVGAESPLDCGNYLTQEEAMKYDMPDTGVPASEDFATLMNEAGGTSEWTDSYEGTGVAGTVIHGAGAYAENHIFLPAGGFMNPSKYPSRKHAVALGEAGFYWMQPTKAWPQTEKTYMRFDRETVEYTPQAAADRRFLLRRVYIDER